MFLAARLRRFALALLALSCGAGLLAPASAQHAPAQLDSARILHRLEKLEVLGSVLYVAAHPDDENTRLLSWLSNGRKVRTGYLSLTRGDGGQNLIGPEFGDALGIIRTQELLEARRIDGGEQFFTRAVDFGYSKSPEETFAKWGRQEVLGDVVRAIRTFRPDVIVTRFSTDGSGGHGHHTASALLAGEAFDLAADPQAFPEQLAQGLAVWQAQRLFFNGSTWWRADLAKVAEADPQHWLAVDVGGYEPLLGASFNEIAGKSRSQHKSQGFGSAETRGELLEYLRLEKGAPLATRDLFDGLDTTWARVPGGDAVLAEVRALLAAYEPRAPEASHAALCALYTRLSSLAAATADAAPPGAATSTHGSWAAYHARALEPLLLACSGVVLEATADRFQVAAGDKLAITVSALQRRAGPVLRWRGIQGPQGAATGLDLTLVANRATSRVVEVALAANTPADEPHWLALPHGTLHRTERLPAETIAPVVPGQLVCKVALELEGRIALEVDVPVLFKWVDPVAGERTRRVVVTPVASVAPADDVLIAGRGPQTLAVEIEALGDGVSGELAATLPAGWKLVRAPEALPALRRGERRRLLLTLEAEPHAQAGILQLAFAGPRGTATRTLAVIDHAHLLPQTWYTPAEVRLLPLDVRTSTRTVGYVRGAGDEVPRALERLGVQVEVLDPGATDPRQLAKFDAIVTGVRAYNTVDALATFQPALLDYVQAGGTLVVQYNTAGASLVLPADQLGPFPFQLTKSRVTVEEAAPTFVDPRHPLLNVPNVLGQEDFAGWIQERGLYFAGNFDAHYSAPISWSDPGEPAQHGALISCDFGQGRFVYTGISFFRELPAGVPGAYRLFANLIARRSPRE